MTYKLRFHHLAEKEWRKLDETIRSQFKKNLAERLQEPRIPSAALHGLADCYKIKLRKSGYRLVYQVEDDVIFVSVLAIGRRDKNEVYEDAETRI